MVTDPGVESSKRKRNDNRLSLKQLQKCLVLYVRFGATATKCGGALVSLRETDEGLVAAAPQTSGLDCPGRQLTLNLRVPQTPQIIQNKRQNRSKIVPWIAKSPAWDSPRNPQSTKKSQKVFIKRD
eukprot:689157-Amphidinium_carterae.1